MPPALSAVVLYAPTEVQKWEQLEDDPGWWISAALASTKPGDRLAIYRTRADQGVVGVFDSATHAFRGGELGWAAYGRHTPLQTPVPRDTLLHDAALAPVFGNLAGRRNLPKAAADRLLQLLPSIPIARSEDGLPQPGDPDWEWTPVERPWGAEVAASDAIALHEPAWSALAFAAPPQRERSPLRSRSRTDLKGTHREGHGVIVEVKHFVAMSTLQQLDRYLSEARHDGGCWAGHLVALTAYTEDVAQEVARHRDDVGLWVCERDEDDHPDLAQVVDGDVRCRDARGEHAK